MRVYLYIINLTIFLLTTGNAFSNDVARQAIKTYLVGMHTFAADFKQVNALGDVRYGRLYILKPKKVRLDYFTPQEEQLFIDADTVAYYNKTLDEITYLSSEDLPIEFLLDPINQVFNNESVSFHHSKNMNSFSIHNANIDLEAKFATAPDQIAEVTTYNGDDIITLHFSNQLYNQPIDEGIMTFNNPRFKN